MDPSYVDSDEEAVAMAKAMGFSTFGTQGPAKKRKYDPSTDAVVDGQVLDSIDRGGNKGHGSGGNQIPLGKPRVFGVSTNGKTNEIALDYMYEEDDTDIEPAYVDTSLPAPIDQQAKEGIDEKYSGPVYLDTSLLVPNREASATQEKIDAILATPDITPTPPGFRAIGKSNKPLLGQEESRYLTASQHVSQQPPPRSAAWIEARRPTVESHRPTQQGQRNELWYVGYYDPSFNENPWVKLEKERGLKPEGRWSEGRGRAV